ncbi:NlpC/P60 family protein [Streptomyces sp. NPDC018045]|uniref:C40 family peptidase n=1 Tax=Streptomyces sp. NPDC018045 TaxID=3365037 RepID=UPI00378C4D63
MSGTASRTTTLAAASVGVCGAALMSLFLVIVSAASDDDAAVDDGIGGPGMLLDTKSIPPQYRGWIARAAQSCPQLPGPVLAAQIEAESNWQPNAQSRNPGTGAVIAQGIAQFIPATWRTWGVDAASKDGTPKPDGVADPFTPGDAIMTQARYECWLAKEIKSYKLPGDQLSLTLAAYNAGPGAVQSHRGIPPYPETQAYVAKILKLADKYQAGAINESNQTSAFGVRVAAYGKRWLGTPYSWGGGTVTGPGTGFAQGAGTRGFDCSSLVQYAVYQASEGRITLPRTSQVQATQGKPVSRSAIAVGDVVAFALHGGGDYDHIGIYVGAGRFVHAPKTGDVVKISSLNEPYYSSKPQVIRRFG